MLKAFKLVFCVTKKLSKMLFNHSFGETKESFKSFKSFWINLRAELQVCFWSQKCLLFNLESLEKYFDKIVSKKQR